MPTVYSRLQEYKKNSPVVLSRKKYKILHHTIKNIYNRREVNPPPSYIQSIEDGVVFKMVRDYPDSLTPTIDGLIHKFATKSLQNNIKNTANLYPKPPAKPETVPKERSGKRKRIIKPVYSTRKTTS